MSSLFSRVRFIGVLGALFLVSMSLVQGAQAAAKLSTAQIRTIQNTLISEGYLGAGKNTGTLGPQTVAAIKKYQCATKIVCSGGSGYGLVGPRTLAALTGGSTGGGVSSAPSGSFEVGGWIPYWRSATGTADVLPHLASMTEVSPFGYTIKNDGTLFDAAKVTQEPWVSFIAAARQSHTRVVPTVMSSGGDFLHGILSNPTSRVALEDDIAAVVVANNFDGIDIDFEAKLAETKPYFSLFLKGLSQRLGKKYLYCSIEARTPLDSRYDSTPPADATEYSNDYKEIGKYCDRVEIMAYDQGAIDLKLNRSRAAPYVPVSDPAWVQKVIEVAAADIPKSKLIIGIATYGYEYSVKPLSEYGYRYDRQWAFNPGYATQLAAQLNIQPVRNSAGELSFIYKSSTDTDAAVAAASVPGSIVTSPAQANTVAPPTAVYSQATFAGTIQPPFNIVWWSDAQAVNDKVTLAKKLGVRGVSLFKLDGGEDQGLWAVLPKGSK